MKYLVGLIVLFQVFLLDMRAQVGAHPASQQWTTIENFAVEQFFNYGISGSILLNGTCRAKVPANNIVTERIPLLQTGTFKEFKDALNAIASLNQHLSWTRQRDGLVHLKDDRVIASVLSVSLQSVKIRSKVDPDIAIDSLMEHPEVVSFMKNNGIKLGTTFTGSILSQNWKRSPSISKRLENITVEQALDQIASMQHGVWIYNECSTDSEKEITIRFAQVR